MGQSMSEYRQTYATNKTTVSKSETISKSETVTKTETVTKSETVTSPDTSEAPPPIEPPAPTEPAAPIKEVKGVSDEEASAVRQQLDFLVNAANLRLDAWQHEMDAMFSDPASVQKRQVPGIRALRWMRGYRVGVSSKGAEDKIKSIIGGLFVDNDEKDLRDALEIGTTQSMQEILSNTHAGEQSEEKFFVFMKNNAVLRLDVRVWRYNFEGENVMAKKENVCCYIACLSVVDHKKLELSELVYLVSEYSLNQDHVRKYATDLAELWVKLDGIKAGALSLTGEAQPGYLGVQPIGQLPYGHQGRYSPQPSPRIRYGELPQPVF